MISLNPAGSWVMAQHWGGLHAITALFHNRLVSWRAGACQDAGRQAGRQDEAAASAAGWHRDVLRVARRAEQHILSVRETWLSFCTAAVFGQQCPTASYSLHLVQLVNVYSDVHYLPHSHPHSSTQCVEGT